MLGPAAIPQVLSGLADLRAVQGASPLLTALQSRVAGFLAAADGSVAGADTAASGCGTGSAGSALRGGSGARWRHLSCSLSAEVLTQLLVGFARTGAPLPAAVRHGLWRALAGELHDCRPADVVALEGAAAAYRQPLGPLLAAALRHWHAAAGSSSGSGGSSTGPESSDNDAFWRRQGRHGLARMAYVLGRWAPRLAAADDATQRLAADAGASILAAYGNLERSSRRHEGGSKDGLTTLAAAEQLATVALGGAAAGALGAAEAFLHAAAPAIALVAPRMNQRALDAALAACAATGAAPEGLLAAARAVLLRSSHALLPSSAVAAAWAFARLQRADAQLFHVLASAVVPRVAELTGEECAQLAWAGATAAVAPAQLFDRCVHVCRGHQINCIPNIEQFAQRCCRVVNAGIDIAFLRLTVNPPVASFLHCAT